MAYQLVYTSAPRLLEAGRTGFGTVARHRAVTGTLLSAVERASAFARIPGVNPRRVVLSHRLIHTTSTNYHLFSCIRDAGSDYTGRTHHLAHHLIAEAREAHSAADRGLNPADVLMQMKWLSTWSEAPRFFELKEEVSLTSFHPVGCQKQWQNLTGRAETAHLLAEGQRCLLLLPAGQAAIELIHESLTTMIGPAAWQVSFTTHAEPTDDLQEMRWLALPQDSPLRPQVESATRLIFDLTRPEALPEVAPRPSYTTPGSSTLHIPRPERELITPSGEQSTAPLPLPFPEVQRVHPPRRAWPRWLGWVGLVMAVGSFSWFYLPKLPRVFLKETSTASKSIRLAHDVDEIWVKHRLALPTTQTWLKAQADEALIASHAATIQAIQQVLKAPLRPVLLRSPESTQDEFMALIEATLAYQTLLQEKIRSPDWASLPPAELLSRVEQSLHELKLAWSHVTPAFRQPPLAPEDFHQELHSVWLKRLSQKPEGQPTEWLQLFGLLQQAGISAPQWLTHWEKLDQATDVQANAALTLPEAPDWFRQALQQRLRDLAQPAPALVTKPDAMPAVEPAIVSNLAQVPADSPFSQHPRFLLIASSLCSLEQAMQQLPRLPVQPEMQISIGGIGTSEPLLVALKQLGAPGVYRQSFRDTATLEFRQHRLHKLPTLEQPQRLVARSASQAEALFEVISLPPGTALADIWLLPPDFELKIQKQGASTYLETSTARWLHQIQVFPAVPLRLQHTENPQTRFKLVTEGQKLLLLQDLQPQLATAQVQKHAQREAEIFTLRQGLFADEKRRTEIMGTNLAKSQKEDQLRRLDESMALRQQRLLQAEEDLKSSQVTAPDFVGLPAGTYSLFAGLRRLCEVKVSATSSTQLSPNNP